MMNKMVGKVMKMMVGLALLASLLPFPLIHAEENEQPQLIGRPLPHGTREKSSIAYPQSNIEQLRDGDVRSGYKVWAGGDPVTADIEIHFSEPYQMNAIQLVTGSDTVKRNNVYKIWGLKNGEWIPLAERSYNIEQGFSFIQEPIPIAPDWYDGLKFDIKGDWKIDIREINYDSSLPAPTALQSEAGNGQVHLKWNPVENADNYVIRYRPALDGKYREVIVPATAYSGYILTGLENTQVQNFIVAAIHNGIQSNFSNRISAIPLGGYYYPEYTSAKAINGSLYTNDTVSHLIDGNFKYPWYGYRWKSDNPEKIAEFSISSQYPIYMNALEFVIESGNHGKVSYTITGYRNDEKKFSIKDSQIQTRQSADLSALKAVDIPDGSYDRMDFTFQSTDDYLAFYEVLYRSEHQKITSQIRAESDESPDNIRLSWEPVDGAEGYNITWGYDQMQTVRVPAEAYRGYIIKDIINAGEPTDFSIQAIVDGKEQNYSERVQATPKAYPVGEHVPQGTKVTANNEYNSGGTNGLAKSAADHNIKTYWRIPFPYSNSGMINFAFPKPVDIHAVQLVNRHSNLFTDSPVTSKGEFRTSIKGSLIDKQKIQIYGLQNDKWILLKDEYMYVPEAAAFGKNKPIPVRPGKYEGIMIYMESQNRSLYLHELMLFYNTIDPASAVTEDVYGITGDSTVIEDTYTQ
ncbi:hypothetical protein [Paenibacillus sp. Z6-24]